MVRRYREPEELGVCSCCRQGAQLKSSGCLTGERCGGVAVCLFPLNAAGRCLRQPRHTPLITLPLNAGRLAAAAVSYVCVGVFVNVSSSSVHKRTIQVQPSSTEYV